MGISVVCRVGSRHFIVVTLSLIDPDFAKKQLLLLGEVRLMHPNGTAAGL